jgi:hypothetical protein
MDFAHGDIQRANIDFLAAANGASGYADFRACWDVCHVISPKYHKESE